MFELIAGHLPHTAVIVNMSVRNIILSGERMCTILVNRLEDKACPVNVWLGKLTALE